MNTLDSKVIKHWITSLCLEALKGYSRIADESIRGFDVTEPQPNKLLIHIKTKNGPRFFNIDIKESMS